MTTLRGITTYSDGTGATRYRVRVRRQGQTYTARFDDLGAAVSYRDQALGAVTGRNDAPAKPTPNRLAVPAGRAVTVEDAARRLCKGMLDGTVRTRDGGTYKPGTIRVYEEALRLLVLPVLGSVQVADLTHGDVQRFVDQLAADRTPEHARQALRGLRVALNLAVRYSEIHTSPCAGVRCPVAAQSDNRHRVLTPEQVSAIIAAADADDARLGRSFAGPLVALAAGTGLRSGELYGLAWGTDGLDLDAGTVTVSRAVDRRADESGRYPMIAPKSRAGRRSVPIPPEDVARLRLHQLATGRRDGQLVFADKDGQPLSPVPGHRAFKRAAAAAGLTWPHLHDLRHAFATHALAAGLSAHVVARLLGHTGAALVLNRYGHAMPDELASAGDTLSAWRAARAG